LLFYCYYLNKLKGKVQLANQVQIIISGTVITKDRHGENLLVRVCFVWSLASTFLYFTCDDRCTAEIQKYGFAFTNFHFV